MTEPLDSIKKQLLDFRHRRDWKQFHDPKNLAEALAIEAGELLEVFLWKRTEQSHKLSETELQRVKEEAADIFAFLTYLCEELDIDLLAEVSRKLSINEGKYPVAKSKGSNRKYTEL